MTVDWGAIPDWLTGAVAIVALFWARKAAVTAGRTDERQGRQLAELLSEQRRSQAAGVGAWTTIQDDRLTLYIRNPSDLPIYGLAGVIGWPGVERMLVEQEKVVPPRRTLRRQLSVSNPPDEPATVVLAFRDAAGRFWYRAPNADLIETSRESVSSFIIDIREGRDYVEPQQIPVRGESDLPHPTTP